MQSELIHPLQYFEPTCPFDSGHALPVAGRRRRAPGRLRGMVGCDARAVRRPQGVGETLRRLRRAAAQTRVGGALHRVGRVRHA